MSNISGRLMGFIVIGVTIIMSATIYTANAGITSANLTNITALSDIAGFGPLIMILGLLFTGGMLTYASFSSPNSKIGKVDIRLTVGSVVLLIAVLSVFPGLIISGINNLIGEAIDAGDTDYITVYGLIPTIIYVVVIGGTGAAQVIGYKRIRKAGRSGGSRSPARRMN